jgi:hypothetical protein
MNHDNLVHYFQHQIELLGAPNPKFSLPLSRLSQSQDLARSIESALQRGRLTDAEAEGLRLLNSVNVENFSRQVNN